MKPVQSIFSHFIKSCHLIRFFHLGDLSSPSHTLFTISGICFFIPFPPYLKLSPNRLSVLQLDYFSSPSSLPSLHQMMLWSYLHQLLATFLISTLPAVLVLKFA